MRAITFGGTFQIIDFFFVVLRVVDFDVSITFASIFGLNTFSIFIDKILVSDLFVPRPKVAVDIEVFLKLRLGTATDS